MDLALFDFDGTITASDSTSGGDSFSEFVRLAARPARTIVGGALLGPVVVGYHLHWISASRARRAVARVGFLGDSAARVRRLGMKYATEVLPLAVRPRALDRIRWHQDHGDDVVVVSAALDVYLRPWCHAFGLQCVCTELEERNGLLTGTYRDGDCTGGEKVRRTVKRFPPERYSIIYAYGDTPEDREMLDLAHRKYYRWREIDSWNETTAAEEPADNALQPAAARRRGGGRG
jgi:HAD superfamily hydrolase (TIGR01490 family)